MTNVRRIARVLRRHATRWLASALAIAWWVLAGATQDVGAYAVAALWTVSTGLMWWTWVLEQPATVELPPLDLATIIHEVHSELAEDEALIERARERAVTAADVDAAKALRGLYALEDALPPDKEAVIDVRSGEDGPTFTARIRDRD